MTTETGAPAGDSATADVTSIQLPGTGEMSAMDAARALAEAREKRPDEQAESATPPATAEQESTAKAEDAAPDDTQAPSEVTETSEPEIPPIERPRSWAKELDEEWNSYPREAQEKIAKREQERDAAIRRSQNEAAEIRKAADAERKAAEEAKKQYEAQLPALMQALQDAQSGTFSDIKTVDDVTRLASEDPFRYLQWQAHQTKLQAVNAELARSNEEKSRSEQSSWSKHVQEENAKAVEFIPELADKTKSDALTKRVATELLPDLGFSDSELADLANGRTKLSIFDHRVQRLLADAVKLRDIQSAPKAVVKPNLPPVQRPGTAPARASSASSEIQNLRKQLANASGMEAIRLGAKLTNLERAAR